MKLLSYLILPVLALSLTAPPATAANDPASLLPPKPFVPVSQVETRLAQGLMLTSFERLYPSGWVNGWLLKVHLSHPSITTDVVTAPGVTKGEALSAMAVRAGAVAAVNGDFFDIGQTGIALGSVVRGGEFLQSRIPEWPNAAGVGKDRIGQLLDVTLEGTVTLPSGSYKLGAINLPTVQSHTIGLFTPMWTISRDRAMYGATEAREVVVRAGKVTSVSDKVTAQPVPADGFVLVGREEFAKPLAALKVGDPVMLSYRSKPDAQWAVGGYRYLVKDGRIAELDDKKYMPRSALGFSADGRQLFLLAADGRSEASGGVTLRGLAEMMLGFGATDVLELDGGGSTTMVARRPGEQGLSVLNQPSDGRERSIPNGVAIFATPGSGVADSLTVVPGGEARVFPGLTRRLSVAAYDEQFGPAPVGFVAWRSQGVGSVSPEGLFRSDGPGKSVVTAQALVAGPGQPSGTGAGTGQARGGRIGLGPLARVPGATVTGRLDLTVLGPLERIVVDGEGLRLSPGQTGSFTIRGYDAEGYGASIDPSDLTFSYDTALLRVEVVAGGVRVTPQKDGVGLIKVTVQGKEAWVPVASARAFAVVDVFDRIGSWMFEKYPATVTGALSAAPGRSGLGLKLSYAFGNEGGNRAAYAQATPLLELPGRSETVGLWVKGDGKGAWLRAVLIDANGATHTINLVRHVDWTDWRYVEAPVPAGAAFPVKLYRIYPVETDAERHYSGELIFDDLTVRSPVAPPPIPPISPARPDPILQPAKARAGNWSFGLVGGLGQPGAEQLIRQMMAARPAFLLVDPASATTASEALLAQEAGTTPVYRITRPARWFDLNGIRFILVGNEKGSLRATEFEQLLELKAMLDLARLDTSVRRVVVLGHHAPLSFTDRREGELVARWLSQFRALSGKEAAYVAAGGGALSVRWVEGVPFIEAGSPKAPLLFTVDPAPAQGAPWIRLQTN